MKAIFLDRDGVVNELVYHEEPGIIDSPFTVAQFKLLLGVPGAIRQFRDMGYKVIIISNQPGMAKRHMSEETFNAISRKMKDELAGSGAFLDGEYYCFHHPEAVVAELKADCECRKPKPGLLLRAAREMDIDLPQSWMIGDELTDVKAGKAAGVRTVLLGRMKCELCRLMDEEDARPDIICTGLPDVVEKIMVKV